MLKKGLLFCAFILLSFTIYAQTITLASWNLKNLGSSKTQEEIEYIATLARDLDVLVIQEVVTNPSGAQTVAKIADELNRKGAAWDYAISPPTISSPYRAERYAYFWKKSKLTQKKRPGWIPITSTR